MRRHNLLMSLRSIGSALPHSLKREVLKMQIRKVSANLNYFGTKNVPHVLTKKMTTHTCCFVNKYESYRRLNFRSEPH